MVSLDSVETRRRLLRRLPDVIIVVLAFIAGWFFLLRPVLQARLAPPAPVFRVMTLTGQPFVLQTQRGHMVVLDFFATWCEPCQQSLPIVEDFAAHHPDVTVIAINENESIATVAAFAKRYRLATVGLDEHGVIGRAYGLTGFPTLVGIDDQGRIRNTWFGYSPDLGERLLAAKTRYDALRRERKDSKPARPS